MKHIIMLLLTSFTFILITACGDDSTDSNTTNQGRKDPVVIEKTDNYTTMLKSTDNITVKITNPFNSSAFVNIDIHGVSSNPAFKIDTVNSTCKQIDNSGHIELTLENKAQCVIKYSFTPSLIQTENIEINTSYYNNPKSICGNVTLENIYGVQVSERHVITHYVKDTDGDISPEDIYVTLPNKYDIIISDKKGNQVTTPEFKPVTYPLNLKAGTYPVAELLINNRQKNDVTFIDGCSLGEVTGVNEYINVTDSNKCKIQFNTSKNVTLKLYEKKSDNLKKTYSYKFSTNYNTMYNIQEPHTSNEHYVPIELEYYTNYKTMNNNYSVIAFNNTKPVEYFFTGIDSQNFEIKPTKYQGCIIRNNTISTEIGSPACYIYVELKKEYQNQMRTYNASLDIGSKIYKVEAKVLNFLVDEYNTTFCK